MAHSVAMFFFGLAQGYSPAVFTVLPAVWFMSIGYLLVTNLNRRIRPRVAPCSSGESFLDARDQRAFQRG